MVHPAQRIIVKFKPTRDATAHTLRELSDQVAEMLSGTLLRPPSSTGRAVFRVRVSSELDRLIEEIQKLPSVEYAERDVIDRALDK
jgi:hypothetical protein